MTPERLRVTLRNAGFDFYTAGRDDALVEMFYRQDGNRVWLVQYAYRETTPGFRRRYVNAWRGVLHNPDSVHSVLAQPLVSLTPAVLLDALDRVPARSRVAAQMGEANR